jgi:uncharacterized protein (DUF169 family)
MASLNDLENALTTVLDLRRRPVAISFVDAAPPGISALQGTQPSGCSFWRLAAHGRAFYTVPADHLNCPVGSYTHNIDLPAEREAELMGTLSLMSDIGYIKMTEVPSIPRLPNTPKVIVYAPLADAPVAPDVVVLSGRPSKLMLLHEAAGRAAVATTPLLGRPTCMAVPAALAGGVASSLGCIGNRVYTDVADDEFYSVIAGADLVRVAEALATIVSANQTLAAYHRERRGSLERLA